MPEIICECRSSSRCWAWAMSRWSWKQCAIPWVFVSSLIVLLGWACSPGSMMPLTFQMGQGNGLWEQATMMFPFLSFRDSWWVLVFLNKKTPFYNFLLPAAAKVRVVPADSSWAGTSAVLPEEYCRQKGQKHVSSKCFPECRNTLGKSNFAKWWLSQQVHLRSWGLGPFLFAGFEWHGNRNITVIECYDTWNPTRTKNA